MVTGVPTDDRGLQYGEGVFETVRVDEGYAPFLPLHEARMLAGCRRLGLPVAAAEVHRQLASAVASAKGSQVVKLTVTGGSAARGYARPAQTRPRWLCRISDRVPRPDRVYQQGMVTGVCQQRLAEQPALAGIKHLNRLEQVLAAGEVQRHGWDEGLMLDFAGRPVEWTAMSLFARFGDRLWTPPVARQGVAGVLRQWLLDQWLPQSSLRLDCRPLSLATLRQADEVFAGNSVAGFVSVRKLAVWQWESRELAASLQHTFSGLFQR